MDFKDGTAVTHNEEGIVLSSKTVNYKSNDGSLHSIPLINRNALEKAHFSGTPSKTSNDQEISNSNKEELSLTDIKSIYQTIHQTEDQMQS